MKLERQTIIDLLVTALEGGSNYWYTLSDTFGATYTDELVKMILDDKYLQVFIYDVEEPESEQPLGILSSETIAIGQTKFRIEYPDHFIDCLKDEWDTETSDVFLQMVVMGEVRFG